MMTPPDPETPDTRIPIARTVAALVVLALGLTALLAPALFGKTTPFFLGLLLLIFGLMELFRDFRAMEPRAGRPTFLGGGYC